MSHSGKFKKNSKGCKCASKVIFNIHNILLLCYYEKKYIVLYMLRITSVVYFDCQMLRFKNMYEKKNGNHQIVTIIINSPVTHIPIRNSRNV